MCYVCVCVLSGVDGISAKERKDIALGRWYRKRKDRVSRAHTEVRVLPALMLYTFFNGIARRVLVRALIRVDEDHIA